METEVAAKPSRVNGIKSFWRAWVVRSLVGAVLLGGVLLGAAKLYFGSLAVAAAYLNGERLIVVPATINAGPGRQGEKRPLRFRVAN